jgi:hypothetical protein
MGRFVGRDEVREIRAPWWEEGETVTIRRLSYLDRREVAGESTRTVTEEDGATRVTMDLAALDRALLAHGIAGWTLKGADGQTMQLNAGAIEQLREEDGEFILQEIGAFNPRRTVAEQAVFRGAAGSGAAEQ